MKLNKRLFKAIFVIYLFFFNFTIAIENKILFKVNNEIITSIDILNEINYLNLINSDFQKLDKQRMYDDIAGNPMSIITTAIRNDDFLNMINLS